MASKVRASESEALETTVRFRNVKLSNQYTEFFPTFRPTSVGLFLLENSMRTIVLVTGSMSPAILERLKISLHEQVLFYTGDTEQLPPAHKVDSLIFDEWEKLSERGSGKTLSQLGVLMHHLGVSQFESEISPDRIKGPKGPRGKWGKLK